jgi:hypothetical protein
VTPLSSAARLDDRPVDDLHTRLFPPTVAPRVALPRFSSGERRDWPVAGGRAHRKEAAPVAAPWGGSGEGDGDDRPVEQTKITRKPGVPWPRDRASIVADSSSRAPAARTANGHEPGPPNGTRGSVAPTPRPRSGDVLLPSPNGAPRTATSVQAGNANRIHPRTWSPITSPQSRPAVTRADRCGCSAARATQREAPDHDRFLRWPAVVPRGSTFLSPTRFFLCRSGVPGGIRGMSLHSQGCAYDATDARRSCTGISPWIA